MKIFKKFFSVVALFLVSFSFINVPYSYSLVDEKEVGDILKEVGELLASRTKSPDTASGILQKDSNLISQELSAKIDVESSKFIDLFASSGSYTKFEVFVQRLLAAKKSFDSLLFETLKEAHIKGANVSELEAATGVKVFGEEESLTEKTEMEIPPEIEKSTEEIEYEEELLTEPEIPSEMISEEETEEIPLEMPSPEEEVSLEEMPPTEESMFIEEIPPEGEMISEPPTEEMISTEEPTGESIPPMPGTEETSPEIPVTPPEDIMEMPSEIPVTPPEDVMEMPSEIPELPPEI